MAAAFRTGTTRFWVCNAVSRPALHPECFNKMFNNNLKYSTRAERKIRRQELIADFKRDSYFAHIKEFQRSGGKRFEAPKQLIKAEDSVQFPAFTAKALSGRSVNLENEFSGHVTLLLIALRGIAQPMCDLYREPFQNFFKDAKNAKLIEVNAVEHWFYGLFRSFISRSLKTKITPDRHDNFLCYFGSVQQLKKKELLGNLIVGHAYLVDRKGVVRWKACANPTETEIASMIACAKQLLP